MNLNSNSESEVIMIISAAILFLVAFLAEHASTASLLALIACCLTTFLVADDSFIDATPSFFTRMIQPHRLQFSQKIFTSLPLVAVVSLQSIQFFQDNYSNSIVLVIKCNFQNVMVAVVVNDDFPLGSIGNHRFAPFLHPAKELYVCMYGTWFPPAYASSGLCTSYKVMGIQYSSSTDELALNVPSDLHTIKERSSSYKDMYVCAVNLVRPSRGYHLFFALFQPTFKRPRSQRKHLQQQRQANAGAYRHQKYHPTPPRRRRRLRSLPTQ